jgi:hypothetical protein
MIDPPPPVTGTRRKPTRADVQALYARLVHSYGPPIDSAAVFAQAVAAAMWEALGVAEYAESALKVHETEAPTSLRTPEQFHLGQIYTANKIMRAVFDSLNPGKGCSVGLRLATRRAVCGLPQSEVADAVPMDRSHLGRIERGEKELRPADAVIIAGLLGCTPGYLLTGEGGRP